jgi:hypothetical protein
METLPRSLACLACLLLALIPDTRASEEGVEADVGSNPQTGPELSTTLERLRQSAARRLERERLVFYAPGFRERAEELSEFVDAADEFFGTELGIEGEFSLAVLDESIWAEVTEIPYGVPFNSGEPSVLVLAGNAADAAPYRAYAPHLGDRQARLQSDNFAIHELGHLYAGALLYGEEEAAEGKLRWFDEFAATYLALAFLEYAAPERAMLWYRASAVELSAPCARSIDAFQLQYFRLAGPECGNNYGWYQNQFGRLAEQILPAEGIDFLRSVRRAMNGIPFTPQESETLDRVLRASSPAYEPWRRALTRAGHE